MRHILLVPLLSAGLACSPVVAQTNENRPAQTARQALIEMFLGKGTDDFSKHLPEDARRTLIRTGETPETSWVLRIADMGMQMTASGEHIETFDTGPNILVSEQQDRREKIEIAVEHDSLIGEGDEIELSVHFYRDGQPVPLPVIPRLTFTLGQEKEIWRLTEVTAAAHVPLTDPEYLKGLRKQQDESNEGTAQSRLTFIGIAEKGYAARHADRGYTCSLSALFNVDPAAPTGESYYDPGQGKEEWNGYRFAITGCEGSPVSKYRVTAAPIDPDTEMKTYCADESGTMKFAADGKPSSCFSRGQTVNAGSPGIAD